MTEQLSPIPLHKDYGEVARRNVASLVRVAITKAIAKLDRRQDERAILKAHWPNDATAALILRAPTSPTSLSGTPALAATIVSDLISTLGPEGAGARLLQAGLHMTFNNFAEISVPALQAQSNQASFVAESAPIPVHNLVSKASTLTPRKIATAVSFTQKMIESSNIEAPATDALLRSVSLALDAALFDATAADAIRPAGLRNGIAALTASAATIPDDAMIADLSALGGAVAAIGEPTFVVSPERAIQLRLRARRSPFPFVVLSSPSVAPADIIAIAPTGLASAVANTPIIDSSWASTLHEEDTNPLPIISGSTVASPSRSLMQTDSIGIRIIFDCDWVVRDPKAISWTTATAW